MPGSRETRRVRSDLTGPTTVSLLRSFATGAACAHGKGNVTGLWLPLVLAAGAVKTSECCLDLEDARQVPQEEMRFPKTPNAEESGRQGKTTGKLTSSHGYKSTLVVRDINNGRSTEISCSRPDKKQAPTS